MINLKLKFTNYFKTKALHNLVNRYNTNNNWAIITGCTSGIGRSFAEILSENGTNLILISRNEEKLKILQEKLTLSNKYTNIETLILPWDFSNSEMYSNENMNRYIEEFSKMNIRLLINNVGESSYGGDFINEDLNKTKSIINVNIMSNIFMTKLFVKSQVKYSKNRLDPEDSNKFKRGIINISSYFGKRAVPGVTTYSSSKAFVSNLSECLYYELQDNKKEINCDILCVNPLFVKTNMVRKWKDSKYLITPEELVYSSFNKLGGLKFQIYGSWKHSIQSFLLNLIPNFIFCRLIHNFYKKQYEKLFARRRRT